MTEKTFFIILFCALALAGVIWYIHMTGVNAQEAARITVIDFGQALQTVSLSAPSATVTQEMQSAYGPFVSPDVLALWEADPTSAPGRLTSSPWPDHIAITSLTTDGVGGYHVQGNIIELTSEDVARGTEAGEMPFTATVSLVDGKWMITAWYTTGMTP